MSGDRGTFTIRGFFADLDRRIRGDHPNAGSEEFRMKLARNRPQLERMAREDPATFAQRLSAHSYRAMGVPMPVQLHGDERDIPPHAVVGHLPAHLDGQEG